jgi:hypothetical protein
MLRVQHLALSRNEESRILGHLLRLPPNQELALAALHWLFFEVTAKKAAHRCSRSLLWQCGQTTLPFSYSASVRTSENSFLQARQQKQYWGKPPHSHGDTALFEYDPATADMEQVNKVIAEYEAKTGAQPFDMATGERVEKVTRAQNEVLMVHPIAGG